MSSRGTANILTRATAILAAIFFCTSLLLSILAGIDRKPTSILQNSGGAPGQPAPGGPVGPSGGGGLFDQLRQSSEPPQPTTPQAPKSQ
jgi:preprotein translocase subunit SecG